MAQILPVLIELGEIIEGLEVAEGMDAAVTAGLRARGALAAEEAISVGTTAVTEVDISFGLRSVFQSDTSLTLDRTVGISEMAKQQAAEALSAADDLSNTYMFVADIGEAQAEVDMKLMEELDRYTEESYSRQPALAIWRNPTAFLRYSQDFVAITDTMRLGGENLVKIYSGVGIGLITADKSAQLGAQYPDLKEQVAKVNLAIIKFHDIILNWRQFTAKAYRLRANLGVISTKYHSMVLRLQVFCSLLNTLDKNIRSEVIPAIGDMVAKPSAETLKILKWKLSLYGERVVKIATLIAQKEVLMVKRGLQNHIDDAKNACAMIGYTASH